MIEKIFFKQKLVGEIDYNLKTYKSTRTRDHYFYKFEGLGISVKVLDRLLLNRINNIIIYFEGTKLETDINNFVVNGIEWNDGGDLQLILPLKYFNKKVDNEIQISL